MRQQESGASFYEIKTQSERFLTHMLRRYSLIAVLLSIELFIGCAMFVSLTDAASNRLIGGWAWNPVIGWIRQRDSIIDKSTQTVKGTYGVAKDDQGDLSGWSWSPKYGWICWGKTCADPGASDPKWWQKKEGGNFTYGSPTPPRGQLFAKIIENSTDETKNSVEGWAKILSRGDYGWISLSSKTSGGGVLYGLKYDEAKNEFTGWAWNSARRATLGWIAFSGKTLWETKFTDNGEEKRACGDKCSVSYNVEQNASLWKTQYIGAWLKTKGGNIASRGGFEAGDAPPENLKNAEFLILSGQDSTQATPTAGEIKNFVSLCESELEQVSPLIGGKKACKNFGIGLNMQRVRSGVLSVAPTKKIEITLTRGSAETPIKRKRLQTKGVSIDIDALTTNSVNEATKYNSTKNRYGKKVLQLTPAPPANEDFLSTPEGKLYTNLQDGKLGGTVTTINGDLVIGDTAGPWEVANGSTDDNKPVSGGRTIVVKGNLIIKRPILYASQTGVTSLKQLASIAWVVLEKDAVSDSPGRPADIPAAEWNKGGNILIDDCIPPSKSEGGLIEISELSGLFFAEGKVLTGSGKTASCRTSFNQYAGMRPENDWIKKISGDISLVIRGAIIAKGYALQRSYGGVRSSYGSENILNDGRMLVSVPPGLEDFLKSFPSF